VKAVLALDQGMTGSTALVIGEDGAVLGRGYRELPQHFPAPGMVEHDPEDIVRVTLEAAREALAQATTALGAAGLAGIAAGVWRRAEDFLARRTFRRFTPGPAAVETQRRLGEWRRAVGAALHWATAAKAPGS
jgi:glycerol kinase